MSKLPQPEVHALIAQGHPLADLKTLLRQVLLASACIMIGCLRYSVSATEAAQKNGPAKADTASEQSSLQR